MTTTATLYVLPRPSRRLVLGLGVSLAVHASIILVFTPAPYRYVPAQPLVVEILRQVPSQAPREVPTRAAPEVPAVTEGDSQAPREISTKAPSEVPAQAVSAPSVNEAVTPKAPEPIAAVRAAPLEESVPADKYFTFREVDVRPEKINEVELVYPRRAYALRTRGRVVLRIFISDQGAVDEVSVLDATPPGVFEEAALKAVLALKFKPALKHGRHVRSQSTIEVAFDPYESINIP